MRREVPIWMGVIIIALVVVIVIGVYVALGRRGGLEPTPPPPDFKPGKVGPYKGKEGVGPTQPTQPTPPP